MKTKESSAPDECQLALETAEPRYQPNAAVREEAFAKLHMEWREMIAVRRRRKRSMAVGVAASVAAVVSIVMAVQTSFFLGELEPFGQVVRSNGGGLSVRYSSRGGSPPEEEELLVEGAEISTAADARALVRLSGGGTLRFDQNTEVELMSGSTITLHEGAVYFDSNGSHGAATATSLRIVTPAGTVTHLGTQYMARVDRSGTTVGVREGSVSIRSPSTSMTADAGEMIRFDRRNQATDLRLLPHAPVWDWVMEISPPVPVQGASTAEILDWIARESGRQVDYEIGAASAARSEIVDGLPDVAPLTALGALDHASVLEITHSGSAIRVRVASNP